MGERGVSLTPVDDGTTTACDPPTDAVVPGQLPPPGQLGRAGIVRFVLLLGLISALITFAIVAKLDPRHLVDHLEGGPVPVPLLAIAGGAVLICAFVPRIAVAFAGGSLFGTLGGGCYVLAAVTCGAVLAFGIGRLLGRTFVRTRLRGRLATLDGKLVGRGFTAVVIARMVPIAHFGLSNYAFGTTSVGLPRYTAGTLLGIAPATVAYAALGDAAARGDATHAAFAGVAVTVLSVGGVIASVLLWRWRRRAGATRAHQ
jgi:uncharacterized membrane protein YdjX (TVP38/TMEM64 family)